MNGPNLEQLIAGSEKLTSIFGGWPSFHDAEVTEIHLDRGEINPEIEKFDLPVLTVKIMLWNLTSRVSAADCFETEHHTLAILQFSEMDDLTMSGFNHQNAIMGLQITPLCEDGPTQFQVLFDPAFGLGCEFTCGTIEVLNAVPWDVSKRPTRWLGRDEFSKIK